GVSPFADRPVSEPATWRAGGRWLAPARQDPSIDVRLRARTRARVGRGARGDPRAPRAGRRSARGRVRRPRAPAPVAARLSGPLNPSSPVTAGCRPTVLP